jgi:hypothetical protein
MPVDVVEHFLAGVDKGVQWADAFVGDDDAPLSIDVGVDAQGSLQACDVDAAIGDVTSTGIAWEVVEFVYVECST